MVLLIAAGADVTTGIGMIVITIVIVIVIVKTVVAAATNVVVGAATPSVVNVATDAVNVVLDNLRKWAATLWLPSNFFVLIFQLPVCCSPPKNGYEKSACHKAKR